MKRKLYAVRFLAVCLSIQLIFCAQPSMAAVSFPQIEKILDIAGILRTDGTQKDSLGSGVSRARYAEMLVNLSPYRGKIVKSVKVSVFQDVKKSHWAAGYIKAAVEEGWMSGYLNGKFKPEQTVTLQEAVNGVLKILGYQDGDFSGSLSEARMSMYIAKGLNKSITKTAKQGLTMTDCMNLFYNALKTDGKDGKVYGSGFDLAFDQAGEVDYLGTLNNEMDGPVIADNNWESRLSFANTYTVYYKNGYKSSRSAIQPYDVVYYSSKLNRVWTFDDKITGTIQAVLPNNISPVSVKAAGKEYVLGTGDAAVSLSAYGDFQIGDAVTLLLDKDGNVAAIRDANVFNEARYGVVLDTGLMTEISDYGTEIFTTYVSMVDTKGQEHVYPYNAVGELSKGMRIKAEFKDGMITITPLASVSLTGRVDAAACKIGDSPVAADAAILDYNDGKYVSVPLSRLDKMDLENSSVAYYAKDEKGVITDLIFLNATGDLSVYGMIAGKQKTDNTSIVIQQVPTYICWFNDNTEGTLTTSDSMAYPGACRFFYENGKLSGAEYLSSVNVTSINGVTIKNGKDEYLLADQTSVYYMKNDQVYKTALNKVTNLKQYRLTAYYDKQTTQGGRVRVLVAQNR